MPMTQEQLDQFHHFATDRIQAGESRWELVELLSLGIETMEMAEVRETRGPGQDLIPPDELRSSSPE